MIASGPNTPALAQAVNKRPCIPPTYLVPKDIGQISRDGCKTTTIHGEYNHRRRIKIYQPDHGGIDTHLMRRIRNGAIENDAQREKDPVGIPAAEVIRGAGPDKPTDHIEGADHQHIGRGKAKIDNIGQGRAEYLIHHRFGNRQYTDTRRSR